MIMRILKGTVVSDKSVAHFCQVVCSVVAGLVMVLGIRRLTILELDEAQLYFAMTGTLFLSGVFIVLGFQCRAWRRASCHVIGKREIGRDVRVVKA